MNLSRNLIILFYAIVFGAIFGTIATALNDLVPDSILTFGFVVEAELALAIPLSKMLETKRRIEVIRARDGERFGFTITPRGGSLTKPRVIVNGLIQRILESGLPEKENWVEGEPEIMYADLPYAVYPYRLDCSFGSGDWLLMKVFDVKNNEVLNGEMEIDVKKAQAHTNTTSIPQVMVFNSLELERTERLEFGFVPTADNDRAEAGRVSSPSDLVEVLLVKLNKKPRFGRLTGV